MQSTGEPTKLVKPAEQAYVTAADLAELLHVSRLWVYRRLHDDVIPAVKAGRKFLIRGAFYRDLKAEIDSSRPVDVVGFAKAWRTAHDTPAEAAS
jgi:excisionase family DNA binding protein